MEGFQIKVKSKSHPNAYHVECWPREPQQSRKDSDPQPVPALPKAEVEMRDGEPEVRWTSLPERFENLKGQLEESIKERVKEYRIQNEDD